MDSCSPRSAKGRAESRCRHEADRCGSTQTGRFSSSASQNPNTELAQTRRARPPASSAPESPDQRAFTTTQLTAGFIAQSAAVFRSPRLQENLPLCAEQGRCRPEWATVNEPDPQFRRVVLRHREAQQGRNRFSGERSEPKPSGRLMSSERSEPKPSGRLRKLRES